MKFSETENQGASPSPAASGLAEVLPRVLLVSRRTVRKNKFVDFVGEYHLDLLVKYGAVPVIVPRVTGVHNLLDSFEPIHGVLLCEGEDINPSLYDSDCSSLNQEELEGIKQKHSGDTVFDLEKDSIEFQLACRCLERSIPFLGICRGSQVLNAACGGSLYQDVETELSKKLGVSVKHIDYANYDGHRHPIKVLPHTPLAEWFHQSLEQEGRGEELIVNSYHHQGVRRLAERLQPMAFAPDSLIEAFYDPDTYNPSDGKFIVGLQFHPERLRHQQDVEVAPGVPVEEIYDYPECPRVYQEFVRAVVAFQKRKREVEAEANSSLMTVEVSASPQLDGAMELQRQHIVESFELAKQIYQEEASVKRGGSMHDGSAARDAMRLTRTSSQRELDVGANFLEVNTALSHQQVKRLKQMGATVRNSSMFLELLEEKSRQEEAIRGRLRTMPQSALLEMLEYHRMMAGLAEEVLRQPDRTIFVAKENIGTVDKIEE